MTVVWPMNTARWRRTRPCRARARRVGFQAMPDARVVDQPLADRQVGRERHAQPVELGGGPDPAALEDERRPVRAASEHDRAGLEVEGRAVADHARMGDGASRAQHTVGDGAVEDGQVRTVARVVEVREARMPAREGAAHVHRVRAGVKRLEVACRLHEGALPGREVDLGRRTHPELLLRPCEERLDRRVRPVVAPFVVHRRTPDRGAGVVGRAAADHAGAQLRAVVLRVGLPRVREGERPRVAEIGGPPAVREVPVVRPGLDEADAAVGVLRQPCREHAPRRAAAEDDDVEAEACPRHAASLRRVPQGRSVRQRLGRTV